MAFDFRATPPPRPSGTLIELALRNSDQQAADLRRRGAAKADMIRDVGGTVAGSLMDIAKGRQAQKQAQLIEQAYRASQTDDGLIDYRRLSDTLASHGLANEIERQLPRANQLNTAILEQKKTQAETTKLQNPPTPPPDKLTFQQPFKAMVTGEDGTASEQWVRAGSDGQPYNIYGKVLPEGTVQTIPDKVTPPPAPKQAPLGSFEDYVEKTYPDGATPPQILAARKAYMQSDDKPPSVRVSVQGGAGGAAPDGLNPDAIEYTASQYRILGPSGIPTRLGETDKVHILNEAAKQTKALKQSPAQAIQKQFAMKSDASALTKITTMAAAAQSFETKANAQADLVRSLSKNVGRFDSTILNNVLLSGKAALGDTDTHLFANSLLTFTTEYAKLMEGSTGSAAGSSEGARKDAAKLISTALKDGTIDQTIKQMQWEMGQTRVGYEVTLQAITERMGGGTAAPAGIAPPPAPQVAAARPKVGDVVTVKGQRVRVTGVGADGKLSGVPVTP